MRLFPKDLHHKAQPKDTVWVILWGKAKILKYYTHVGVWYEMKNQTKGEYWLAHGCLLQGLPVARYGGPVMKKPYYSIFGVILLLQ